MMSSCPDDSCGVFPRTREEKRKRLEHDPSIPGETWTDLHDKMWSITSRYFHSPEALNLEESLHDLWDELIHAAKILPPDSADIDRLVLLILEARALGCLTRSATDTVSQTPGDGVLSNGQRFWSDPPYLVQELQDAWTKESTGLTSRERESLAVLTAKICVVGVCPAELNHCALWLFKQTLEVQRPFTDVSSPGEDVSPNTTPTGADLLPACLAWLRYNKTTLAKLTVANVCPVPSVPTTPGDLAVHGNVTQDGFNVTRWLFWRQRFKELYHCGGEALAHMVRACFEEAISAGLHLGINIPGEQVYLDRLFNALDEELKRRGFKGCVRPEDIEIDMNWADGEKAV